MRWWWQKHEDRHDEHDTRHTVEEVLDDAEKHKFRQEQEFIRARLKNLERLMRGEKEQWIPPRS